MLNKNNELNMIKDLLKKLEIDPHAKYLTAKQIELVFGIPSKSVLNRSNLPSTDSRHLPSVRLKGGRKKYFERKVVARFFCLANNAETGGRS